ncbi:MAG: SpoIIIAH-like family protein [Eubacteriales bacterium]|nr:SpoIIIAH-like family protein [Eubacteriales bacterium]
MVSIRKRGAVYGVIGLMLCVAVYLNWSYFQAPDELTVANQAMEEDNDASSVYGEVTAVDSADAKAGGSEEAAASDSDYFAQARLTRQTARDEALTMLRETVSSEDSTEDAKAEASQEITVIAGYTVKEERLESQLKAKGYADAVVYISDDTISVVVASPDGGLTSADAASISEMVTSETGAKPSALRISEAKS